ncbi:MAG: tetratricopeptide (TPR) repeat protein [Kiritimatiellia bacterium]|jgi:tetratricopeptide (TPR) repeat protein
MAAEKTEAQGLSSLGLLAVAIGLLTLLVVGVRTVSNTDFYTHLATSHGIANVGIGGEDTMSFTTAGKPWIKATWMYDKLMGSLYAMGGGGLATIAHMLSILVAFVLLIPVARRWASGNAIGIALVVCAWLLAARFEPRSALFALVFPAIFVNVLQERMNGPTWLPFAILLPVQILWANMHTSFLMGPIIVVVFGVEAYFRTKKKKLGATLGILGALAVGCLLVSMANPVGPKLYGYVLAGWSESLFSASQFWGSPFIDEFVGQKVFPLFYLVMGIGACGLIFYRERLPLGITIIALFGAFIALYRYQEAIELFTILLFPFLCLCCQSIGNAAARAIQGTGNTAAKPLEMAACGLAVILGIGTVSAFASNSYFVKSGNASAFGLGTNKDIIPAEALELLQRAEFPSRMLNLPIDGCFIEMNTDKQVLIDQRARLHTREGHEKIMSGLLGLNKEDADVVYGHYNATAVVINSLAPNAEVVAARLLATRNWRPAYFDGTTLVLLLNTPENQTLLGDEELKSRGLALIENARQDYHKNLGGMKAAPLPARLIGAASMLMVFNRYAEAYELYELLKAGADAMHTPHREQGICKIQEGEYQDAIRHLLAAKKRADKDVRTWQMLGVAYEKSGEEDKAKQAYAMAKELSGSTGDADEDAEAEEKPVAKPDSDATPKT